MSSDRGLEQAGVEAERAIHDNDVERLAALLADHPDLPTWCNEEGRTLLQATTPYAMDVTDPAREAEFCRPACAALLIDAGAPATLPVWDTLIRSGAAGMLQLLREKNVLPRTLVVLAALGDLDGVRSCLATEDRDLDAANMAFMSACRFKHEAVATMLLERCIELDPALGVEIDRWGDRASFVADMIAHCSSMYGPAAPWPAFVMRRLLTASETSAFTSLLEDHPWLLDGSHVALQVEILEQAAIFDREDFIKALLDHDPALLHSSPPPPSAALTYAFDYGNAHLVPLLTRIWPLPDDLPHAAGVGDLDRVKRWFDVEGRPALGDLSRHHRNVRPGAPKAQQVLDVALAWAVLNKHFDVAELLIAHGADVNTDWATHEPASILHECAVHRNYDGARFLIAHGVDLTLRDHRWKATAAGWARYAAEDEAMVSLLIEAEGRRSSG